MKYIDAALVPKEIVEKAEGHIIDVRFCGKCPYFVPNGVQTEYPKVKGWCQRLSDDEPEPGQWPHYIHVDDAYFCRAGDKKE